MRLIIGIAGKKGSGKDTIAGFLKDHEFSRLAFADPLKEWVAKAMRLPLSLFSDNDKKDGPLPTGHRKVDPFQLLAMFKSANEFHNTLEAQYDEALKKCVGRRFNTPREILQFIGTDIFRDCVAKDFWLTVTERRAEKIQSNIVICDLRFKNEASKIREMGGIVIKVERELESKDKHISELETNEIHADFTIENNGTLEEFRKKVEDVLSEIRQQAHAVKL